jgi:hypothetical protein
MTNAIPSTDSTGTTHFSDAYVLRYLLQQTLQIRPELLWRHDEDDGAFTSAVGPIRLRLDLVHSRSGSLAILSIGNGDDSIHIAEPRPISFFGSQFATPEDAEVAQLLNSLFSAAKTQATRNEKHMEEHLDARKQQLYRQLLFGAGDRP